MCHDGVNMCWSGFCIQALWVAIVVVDVGVIAFTWPYHRPLWLNAEHGQSKGKTLTTELAKGGGDGAGHDDLAHHGYVVIRNSRQKGPYDRGIDSPIL